MKYNKTGRNSAQSVTYQLSFFHYSQFIGLYLMLAHRIKDLIMVEFYTHFKKQRTKTTSEKRFF